MYRADNYCVKKNLEGHKAQMRKAKAAMVVVYLGLTAGIVGGMYWMVSAGGYYL